MSRLDASDSKYAPVSANYPGDILPMYEMRPKSDFETTLGTDNKVQLPAAPNASLAERGNFKFDKYVPYQLELHKRGLFPEFYFHFKKSFSNESPEHEAYCRHGLDEFIASYAGQEEDIQSCVRRVELDFDTTFRQCLHANLRKEFSEWFFTRSCVETQFREKLDVSRDLVSRSERLEQLSQQSKVDWKVAQLVDYFISFGYSELAVWTHLIQIYGLHDTGDAEHRESINSTALKWLHASGYLSTRAQGFADERKAMWSKLKRKAAINYLVKTVIISLSAGFCAGFMPDIVEYFLKTH